VSYAAQLADGAQPLADGGETVAVLLGAGVAAFAVVVGLVVLAFVSARRAVRRRIDRHAPKVRGLVEDVSLKARGYARPGAAGEAVRLQSQVRRSLEHTRRVLDAGYAKDTQLGEAMALFGRLEEFADVLCTDLRMLEREPDPARVGQELPGLKGRAERIERASGSLRWAVQDRERQLAGDDLDMLGRQIADEAQALREPGGLTALEAQVRGIAQPGRNPA
jgi:hypothetical protein